MLCSCRARPQACAGKLFAPFWTCAELVAQFPTKISNRPRPSLAACRHRRQRAFFGSGKFVRRHKRRRRDKGRLRSEQRRRTSKRSSPVREENRKAVRRPVSQPVLMVGGDGTVIGPCIMV